jgi:molybdopterin synthase catalytic subunit
MMGSRGTPADAETGAVRSAPDAEPVRLKPDTTSAAARRFWIGAERLDLATVTSLVEAPDCGAIACFVGTVRNLNVGRRVLWLDYEAYEPLASKAFEQIDREARERWPSIRLAIHHRVGRLEIGEASVVIAAASPHRADAFAASRYAIERIKQIAPIWKHEHFEGGETWIVGATADPTDEAARQHAFERACS